MHIFQDFEVRLPCCPISAGSTAAAQFDLCAIDLKLEGGILGLGRNVTLGLGRYRVDIIYFSSLCDINLWLWTRICGDSTLRSEVDHDHDVIFVVSSSCKWITSSSQVQKEPWWPPNVQPVSRRSSYGGWVRGRGQDSTFEVPATSVVEMAEQSRGKSD